VIIPNVVINAVANWGSTSHYESSMAMDEKLWPNHKLYNYTFNFMAMVMPFATHCLMAFVQNN
jgi:hypothetical protein